MTITDNELCDAFRNGNLHKKDANDCPNGSVSTASPAAAGSRLGTSTGRPGDSVVNRSRTVRLGDTVLPDFTTVRQTAAPIGHNSANADKSVEDLKMLRSILVGPSKLQMEARLEELISILEEREADLVNREQALNLAVTQLEKRLSDTITQAELKHRRVMTEIGNAISSLGNEIATMGGKLRNR